MDYPPEAKPLLLDKRTAAKTVLRIGVRTLDKLMKDGSIPFVRIGTAVRFRVSDLEAFVNAATKGTPRHTPNQKAAA